MRYVKIVFFLLLVFLYDRAVFANQTGEITFLKNGIVQKKANINALKILQKDEVLKVFEPHENSQKNYRGFSVLPLVEAVYGKNQMGNLDTLVFYCTDGYRSDVPLEEFKTKKATLSFAMADGSPFVLKNEKAIPLGPFYLTWDHPDAASAKKNFFRWPYAIHKVDFIDSKKAYQPLLPKANSPENVKTGHREFLKHCFSCHTLNEVGGLRGPPLNYFVQTKTSTELASYILNPKAANKNSQMSGLPAELAGREKVADDIVSYLKKQSQNIKVGE
jgi:mono/diheme cytochrome c family protein